MDNKKEMFQSAFYELLHGISFSKSLIDAISRGGDTDTNAAIVGALLGKFFSLQKFYKFKFSFLCMGNDL